MMMIINMPKQIYITWSFYLYTFLSENRRNQATKSELNVLFSRVAIVSLLHGGGLQSLLFFFLLPLSLSLSVAPHGLPVELRLFLGFLVFPSCWFPPTLDSVCCSLWHIPLCSLSLCQFNHFSHFKMTIPQFYRSSCLSLPVSTLTATPPAPCLTPLC